MGKDEKEITIYDGHRKIKVIINTACPLEKRCKSTEIGFMKCIDNLLVLKQDEKAEMLFDKYADIWC